MAGSPPPPSSTPAPPCVRSSTRSLSPHPLRGGTPPRPRGGRKEGRKRRRFYDRPSGFITAPSSSSSKPPSLSLSLSSHACLHSGFDVNGSSTTTIRSRWALWTSSAAVCFLPSEPSNERREMDEISFPPLKPPAAGGGERDLRAGDSHLPPQSLGQVRARASRCGGGTGTPPPTEYK